MTDQNVHFRRMHILACALLALGLAAAGGCTRTHYRLQADREVRGLIAQKSWDPRWAFPSFPINVDPRSRYFDPTNPDHTPMPQDDPASNRFMKCVDGMKGWPCWEMDGNRIQLENPIWRDMISEYAEITPEDRVKLTLGSAVRLGLINSPNYRNNIEDIYLSALDVSTERFRFDVKFFGNSETAFLHKGELRPPLGETNTLTQDTEFLATKRFATAAEMVIGFANSFVWQFTGPNTNNTNSLLSFNFFQPLLKAGGRVVALEQLTIVERTLLANLRQFQRYRQGFFTNVAIGDGSVQGVQRRGGFLGGTGLTGFSGQGSGGFGEVGQATGFGRITGGATSGAGAGGGATGFAGGGAGTVGGFLGLLQQLQQVRNTQDSLNAQVRTLGLLEANLDAGLIDLAQVDQFRQNIETEKANLLAAQVGLANSLENLKASTLGLPPDLPVELDDSLIQQFRLVDPKTTTIQAKIEDFIHLLGDLPKQPAVEEVADALTVFERLREQAARQFTAGETDLARLNANLPKRVEQMTVEDAQKLREDLQKLADIIDELKTRFTVVTAGAEQLRDDLKPENVAASTDKLVDLSSSLSGLMQELSLVQARARLETVTAENIELTPARALDIARVYRLDWMNNRAALVDTWRLIAFNANALKAGLDITFNGDIGTVGNNAVKFNGRDGTLAAGVRFDAPFTRLIERNNYRQVLINYQQDRRQLIQFEDQTNATLRRLLRQLDQLDKNLEIQRRAVIIAVRRVDQTREILNTPPAPVAAGQTQATMLGPTSAQNLLTALSDLRNSQNNFMSVWLNHYAARMLLMRELGVIEIDQDGIWVDRPFHEGDWDTAGYCELPPDIPPEWVIEANVGCPCGGDPAPWQCLNSPWFQPEFGLWRRAPLDDNLAPLENEDAEALPPGMPLEPAGRLR